MEEKNERRFVGLAHHVPALRKNGSWERHGEFKKAFRPDERASTTRRASSPWVCRFSRGPQREIYAKVTRKFDEEEIRSAVEWWRQQQEEDDRSLRFGLSKEL